MNVVKEWEKDLSFYKDLSEMCRDFGERLRKWIIVNHDFGSQDDIDRHILYFLIPGIIKSFLSGLKDEK